MVTAKVGAALIFADYSGHRTMLSLVFLRCADALPRLRDPNRSDFWTVPGRETFDRDFGYYGVAVRSKSTLSGLHHEYSLVSATA